MQSKRTPNKPNKPSQRNYNPFYNDEHGNLIRIPKNGIKWILEGEEDLYKRRPKPKANLLESLKKIEVWFNDRFGWFFKNGMKG